MKLSTDQVKHVSKLANLKLSQKELEKFAKELSEILSYVEQLSKTDTKNIKPLAHAAGFRNITREDETEPSLSSDEALRNAKDIHNDLIKIEAIFEKL